MKQSFTLLLFALDFIHSQFIHANLTTKEITFSINIEDKDNSLTLKYDNASLSQMNERQKFCLNTQVFNSYSCSVVDSNCCYLQVVQNEKKINITKCVPLVLEDTIFFFNKTGSSSLSLDLTEIPLDSQSYSTVTGNFNVFINCISNRVYSNLSKDTYFFLSTPINLPRKACTMTDPTNNFYKCRRYANDCCYLKTVYPDNSIKSSCVPIDNTTMAAVVSPSSTSPTMHYIKDIFQTTNEYSKTINNVNYNFFCNEDVGMPVSNNTSINTYRSLYQGNYTFDHEDLNCMNWNMKSDVNICRSKNNKGNCCYYYFYPDKRDTTRIVSGCLAFIHPTPSLNFTISFKESNTIYDVTVNCPKIIP
jgi:hypothetical protein